MLAITQSWLGSESERFWRYFFRMWNQVVSGVNCDVRALKRIMVVFVTLIIILLCAPVAVFAQPPYYSEGPEILLFEVSPSAVAAGERATLSWEVKGAQEVQIDQAIGSVNSSGTLIVSPMVTTTYCLEAKAKRALYSPRDRRVTNCITVTVLPSTSTARSTYRSNFGCLPTSTSYPRDSSPTYSTPSFTTPSVVSSPIASLAASPGFSSNDLSKSFDYSKSYYDYGNSSLKNFNNYWGSGYSNMYSSPTLSIPSYKLAPVTAPTYSSSYSIPSYYSSTSWVASPGLGSNNFNSFNNYWNSYNSYSSKAWNNFNNYYQNGYNYLFGR